MSETASQPKPTAPETATQADQGSLLARILATTTRPGAAPGGAEASDAGKAAEDLIGKVIAGSVKSEKAVTRTIDAMVQVIDQRISDQLNEIMHDPAFLKLEGSWRGVSKLVASTNISSTLKIKVLHASKQDLANDFSSELEQTSLYNAMHQSTYNIAGGEPFGALVGDYEWGPGAEDIETLETIAGIARRSFSPFLTAPSPEMLDLNDWTELGTSTGFGTIMDTARFDKWRSFRQTEDAAFVAMAMPRVLARLPYGQATTPVEGFNYEEAALVDGQPTPLAHNAYCWTNAAYSLAARLTEAFDEYGFCTRIRGADSGGRVSNLPLYTHRTADGDTANSCPTEINIPDNVDLELGKLGFLPLVHYKSTDYAVFFGAQTVRKPDKYDQDGANANAEISARLPYIMATSRFAHNLKVMGRNMIGSFAEASDVAFKLDQWIKSYCGATADAKEELKARFPLREARVEVLEVAGQPGVYNAVAYLRPWLQMEELTASLRMVARIPGGKRT